jgi:di/tricarboxylate transporter
MAACVSLRLKKCCSSRIDVPLVELKNATRQSTPFAALVLGVSAVVTIGLLSTGFPGGKAVTAGLLVLTIGFWATNAIPAHITALLLMVGATVFGGAPLTVAFAGFTSTAFWLVFAGAVIGVAMDRTGLTERIAKIVAARLPANYWRTLLWVGAVSALLAFVFPSSTSRIVMLVPIACALAGKLGFAPRSNGSHGIVLTAIFATVFAGYAILPSNLANMVLAGTTESLYGVALPYSYYLLMLFPVLGILGTLLVVAAALIVFPDRATEHPGDPVVLEPWSGPQKRLAALIVLMLAFWLTDTWHHISPAWVGMAAAIVVLLPRAGFLRSAELPKEVNFSILFQVAGTLSLAAIIAHSGLVADFAPIFVKLARFAPDEQFLSYIAFTLSAAVMNLLATPAGLPALLSPVAGQVAAATNFPLVTVQLSQMLAVAVLIFPYQIPPVLMGFQLGNIDHGRALRYMATVAATLVTVLIPLNFLWWRLIGAL